MSPALIIACTQRSILAKLTHEVYRYDPASKALTPDHDNFMIEDDMQMMIGDESVVMIQHSS